MHFFDGITITGRGGPNIWAVLQAEAASSPRPLGMQIRHTFTLRGNCKFVGSTDAATALVRQLVRQSVS